jgi:hypothetical protein
VVGNPVELVNHMKVPNPDTKLVSSSLVLGVDKEFVLSTNVDNKAD